MNKQTKQLIRNIQASNDSTQFKAMKIGMITNPQPIAYARIKHEPIDISKLPLN